MDETEVVEVGGTDVRVNVTDEGAQAEVVETVEAVLVSVSGSEVHLSDLEAADIQPAAGVSNSFIAYFNNEDRHSDSPKSGNPQSGEYDRNWYFTELRSE